MNGKVKKLGKYGVEDIMSYIQMVDSTKAYKWKSKNLTYSIGFIPKQLSRKIVRDVMKIAFEVWSTVTKLNFIEVPQNGNIKIDFVSGEHGDGCSFDGPGKILAHALLPPYGLIHFDADEKWAALIINELSRYDKIDLLPAAIHEIGHILGLEHSLEKDSIMLPVYHYQSIDSNGNYVKPKLTNFDILRIQQLYVFQYNSMRLFSMIISMIGINTYAQYRARINRLSRHDSMECISKQAYYDTKHNYLAIISLDMKCDKLLQKAFEKAITKPDNLKIRIINNPENFEYILQTVQSRCTVTIIEESTTIIWFFFDCIKISSEVREKKNGIMWIIVTILVITAIAICATIGICCYLTLRKRHWKHDRMSDDSSIKEQHTSVSNRNTTEKKASPTNSMKSTSVSSRGMKKTNGENA
ncbi:unnamed protein product [Cercopithifilaria johnstoni]|uniref:Peptidase metallopeptidase domain-containing protein n=1 Tax=Cercopithifilaria johnstoni TaxID=2874296 RepID=A0A8J2M0Y2_9BILA|nr:unnamed protein product [Cercopithifilaria johnstoni]